MDNEIGTTAAIVRTVRDVLGKASIGADDDVFDHGATSLSFVRILARIHQETGVLVHPAALNGTATARALAAQVDADTGATRGYVTSRGA